jgi:hypothetical protein
VRDVQNDLLPRAPFPVSLLAVECVDRVLVRDDACEAAAVADVVNVLAFVEGGGGEDEDESPAASSSACRRLYSAGVSDLSPFTHMPTLEDLCGVSRQGE